MPPSIITKQVKKVSHRFIHRYQPVIKRLIIPVLILEFHPVRCYVTVEFGKLEFQAKNSLTFHMRAIRIRDKTRTKMSDGEGELCRV